MAAKFVRLILGLALLAAAVTALPHTSAAKTPPVCGGPDADTYLYCTSDAPGGPKYNFTDISGTGTKATMTTCGTWGDPQGATPYLSLGFDFKFYGKTYQKVHGSTAGLLLFDTLRYEDCSAYYAIYGIANPGTWTSSVMTPNYLVAPNWNYGGFGLEPTDPTSGIYYETQGEEPNRVFIMQWHNVQACMYGYSFTCSVYSDPTYGYFGQGPNEFEVKLFETTNVIESHTKDAKHSGGGSYYQTYGCTSIGIEGSGAQAGKKWHALAYVNIGAASYCQTTSYTPPTKWAIRYIQDAPPTAAFELFSVPPSIYHNGRSTDDDVLEPPGVKEQDYVHPGDKIIFQDRSTDADGPIKTWLWNFGDGNTSTERNPTYTYGDASATRTVTLIVNDGYVNSNTASRPISVLPNEAPTAIISANLQGLAGQPITFEDRSTDTDGKVTGWFWDFGDSSVSTAQNPQHTFLTSGQYRVKFTAYDDDGAYSNATTTVYMFADASMLDPEAANTPKAEAGPDQTVAPGDVVRLHGYQSNGHAEVYRWSQAQGDVVALSNTASGDPTFVAPALTTDKDGRVQAKQLAFDLTVTDKGRISPPDRVVVTVAAPNSVPLVPLLDHLQVRPGDAVQLDASKTTDADKDKVAFAWEQLSGPAVVLTDATGAQPTFTAPVVDEPTDLVFQLVASDGKADAAPASMVVTVAPGASGFNTLATQDGLRFTPTQLGSTYAWEFGDGASASDAQPVHKYAATGTYHVRLTVVDYEGKATTYLDDVHAFTASDQASKAGASARGAPGAALGLVVAALGAALVASRRKA